MRSLSWMYFYKVFWLIEETFLPSFFLLLLSLLFLMVFTFFFCFFDDGIYPNMGDNSVKAAREDTMCPCSLAVSRKPGAGSSPGQQLPPGTGLSKWVPFDSLSRSATPLYTYV